jgi:hypothetical protein
MVNGGEAPNIFNLGNAINFMVWPLAPVGNNSSTHRIGGRMAPESVWTWQEKEKSLPLTRTEPQSFSVPTFE